MQTNKDGSACNKARSNTFLGLMWSAVAPDFESERRRKHMFQQRLFEEPADPETLLRRLPADWRAPKLESSVVWQPELRRTTPSARKISYEWTNDAGRHVGTLVHEVLKRIARQGVTAWEEQRVAALAPVFRSELQRLGIGDKEIRAASRQVALAVTNMLRSETGRWLLHPHPEARSEWAIGGRVGDRLISGTVDRTFRDEQGRFWIVDYKTSQHEGSDLAEFLEEQRIRYVAQLESYAALVAQMTPGPIHLGLYFPLLDAWQSWKYEEEAVLTAS